MTTALSQSNLVLPRRMQSAPKGRQPTVEITAWNAVTVFGDLQATWTALLEGKSISDHSRAQLAHPHDRAFRLARDVISESGFSDLPSDTALIVGTSKGPIEEWLHPPTSDNPSGGLSIIGVADIATRLAEHLQLSGPRLTLSAACASGLHALIRGAMLIRSGQCRHALIVATEASLHPLFLGSFRRLGVLAKPNEGARPFDQNRDGFLMSEAAAAVLLKAQDEHDVDARWNSPGEPIHLDRFALGGDATHLTGTDPQAKLLKRLLTDVLDDRPVNLIHAHGTGTEQNDAVELAALEDVLKDQVSPPVLWSHKAALGHSLGASGLLSVVLNCQSHVKGIIPANANTTRPLEAQRMILPATTVRKPVRRSLAIAIGFGGPTAVVSLASLQRTRLCRSHRKTWEFGAIRANPPIAHRT